MSTKEKVLFWVAGILLLGIFLYLIKSILLPFVVAIIAAYFLDPAADKLKSWGLSRLMATAVITLVFFAGIIIVIVLLVPVLYDQLIQLAAKMPEYSKLFQENFLPTVARFMQKVDGNAMSHLQDMAGNISTYTLKFLGNVAGGLWQSGLAVVNLLSLLFVTPIVTFYILRDWDKMVQKVNGWLPKNHAHVIREQVRQIDRTLAGYIRGQTNVCVLLGVFYAIGLMLVGLDFGLFIGLITGLLSFIPYVGLGIGMAFGLGVALFQYGIEGISSILMVALVFIVGQVIEGNFITPKLVGDKVGLHPAWIIFGLLAGAALFGFVGVLLAVPVTAIIGVLARFAVERYLQSSLYLEKPKRKQKAVTSS